jgi:hypothetical protein
MDFKSQATSIYNFLVKTKNIWEAEVLNNYPDSFNDYPDEWLESLWNLPINDWHLFDSKIKVSKLTNTTLQAFCDEAANLSKINPAAILEANKLEDWAWIGVKEKKKHEINRLAPHIKKLESNLLFERIIDIGGGVGHFSRVMAHYYQLNCISIDREKSFQESGKKRLLRYRKLSDARDVEFSEINFGSSEDEDRLKNILNSKAFTIGLHTCGNLANTVMSTTLKHGGSGLLSFGCCYHKMTNENDFPKSTFFKDQLPLKLNIFALTLATRAHGPISFSDFELKNRVKNYRGALHLFLYHKLNRKNCFDVGELKNVKEYLLPFSHYIRSKLLILGIDHQFSDREFDDFYNDPKTQSTLKKMFLLSLIRWHIGRVLEVFILLDRVLYLEENQMKVSIQTYFEEEISPRNIGILATKK